MKSLIYPLDSPVILDTLAYERTDRTQSTDPEHTCRSTSVLKRRTRGSVHREHYY